MDFNLFVSVSCECGAGRRRGSTYMDRLQAELGRQTRRESKTAFLPNFFGTVVVVAVVVVGPVHPRQPFNHLIDQCLHIGILTP